LGSVFRRYDGKWSVRKNDGTKRVFDKLTPAVFEYAEWLYHREELAELESRFHFAELMPLNDFSGSLVPA
jgi:hypothetical protein